MNQELKQKYIWIGIGIIIVAIAVVGIIYAFSKHTLSYSTATVERRSLTETVSISGTVVADQAVSLAFGMQGRIATVNVQAGDTVKKGQILATTDQGSIQAGLDGAEADLTAAQAQLSKLQGGTRPEELTIYQQKYNDASTALTVAMNNAYLQVNDAIINKTDALFTNGGTVNPVINVRTQSMTEQLNINQERVTLKDTLDTWKSALSILSAANADTVATSSASFDSARAITKNALSKAQIFLGDLSSIAGNLSVGNSGISQVAIVADTAIVNASSQEVTGTANAETAADAAWSSARDSLSLEQAGSQSQDIQSQQAAVDKAQAEVELYQSELGQSTITAPFDGIVTEASMKVGETFVPGLSAGEDVGLQSISNFKIEGYMPENDIGIVSVGNPATVTFDAYGASATFPTYVSLVDPAETIQNGVNSYKVTLRFPTADVRIKSGLTANALITAATATDALAVPSSALITKSTQTFVLAKNPTTGSFVEKAVTTGISSGNGYTEIISGLNEGDTIASFGASADNSANNY
jgi:RND family efflux transporter MFP subunit